MVETVPVQVPTAFGPASNFLPTMCWPTRVCSPRRSFRFHSARRRPCRASRTRDREAVLERGAVTAGETLLASEAPAATPTH